LYDIDALVRPASRDKAVLYRYLEDGAAGLVIPHVSNADEARDLVSRVKFPPLGDRGTNGKGLEANFGVATTRDQIVSHGLRETFLVVQMESPTSLANIEEIIAVEGVDGVFGGGGDYVIRMQHQPLEQQIPYVEAMRRVAEVCAARGKFWGTMAANEAELRQWHNMGAQLLMWGVDVEIVMEALVRGGEILERL
jgi:2-keto-3-deoxy-L-rhamnonate aldolase RhmA